MNGMKMECLKQNGMSNLSWNYELDYYCNLNIKSYPSVSKCKVLTSCE